MNTFKISGLLTRVRNFMEGRSCNQHKFVEWQFCSGYSLSTSYSPNHWRRDVVVQSLSCVQLFATPWTAACQAPLSFTLSWSLLRLKSIESVMLSNHLILCYPLLLCLQSLSASGSFPISWFFTSGGQSLGASGLTSALPMNIQYWSFRMDWFDLLQSKWLWRVFSSTTVWKQQFFGAQPSLWSNSYIHM